MLFFRFSRSQMLDQRTEFLAEKNTRTWRKERRKGKKIEPKLIRKERKTKKKTESSQKKETATSISICTRRLSIIYRPLVRTFFEKLFAHPRVPLIL